jgi:hypothetical protein
MAHFALCNYYVDWSFVYQFVFSHPHLTHTHTHRHRVVVYPHVREMKRLSAKCGTHSLDELDDPVKAIPTAILND